MLLAGDIGGTKTNLAIFSRADGPRAPLEEGTFPSADSPSLGAIVHRFLSRVDVKVECACFGVAGPVVEGRVEVTNLPWTVDAERLREELDLSAVWLLNDLEAIANAVPILEEPDDLHTLNEGSALRGGSIAVIAPGTGLGEAYLTWDGSRYRAHPSEGGHTDFGPTTPLQVEMLRYLQERLEHVSYEWICSGMGLPNIYAFLKDSGHAEEPAWLAEKLAEAEDPTPVIVNTALKGEKPCQICQTTLDLFVSILGAEAGNQALKLLATGGVYLGGGIPPRILQALETGEFLRAFRSKGRLSHVLLEIPVYVILNSEAALLGAARHGLHMMAEG